jgi:tRNA nucleotidyltransferase/poly(A) polymerase
LFRTVIPTGVQHGTVTVRWRGKSVETTTFRVDGDYRDGGGLSRYALPQTCWKTFPGGTSP